MIKKDLKQWLVWIKNSNNLRNVEKILKKSNDLLANNIKKCYNEVEIQQ